MTLDILSQRAYEHLLKLKSDAGKLDCLGYSALSGNIADHLAEVAANVQCRLLPRVRETRREWEDLQEVAWLKELLSVFKEVFKNYMIRYLEETDLLPACTNEYQALIDEWEDVLRRDEQGEFCKRMAEPARG